MYRQSLLPGAQELCLKALYTLAAALQQTQNPTETRRKALQGGPVKTEDPRVPNSNPYPWGRLLSVANV